MEIVRIIIISLITIFCFNIFGMIILNLKSKKKDKQLKQITIPTFIFLVGVILSFPFIIGVLIALLVAFNEDSLIASIFSFFPIGLGTWLILYSLNWRIEIKDKTFIYRNVFRKESEYSYSDIQEITHTKLNGYKIFLPNKRINMDFYSEKDSLNVAYLFSKHKKTKK